MVSASDGPVLAIPEGAPIDGSDSQSVTGEGRKVEGISLSPSITATSEDKNGDLEKKEEGDVDAQIHDSDELEEEVSTRPPTSTPSRLPSKQSTKEAMIHHLTLLGIDTKGKKETLWRRLSRAHYRHSTPSDDESPLKSGSPTKKPSPRSSASKGGYQGYRNGWSGKSVAQRREELQTKWRSFLCFDVEATCRAGKEFDWPNEIIEFPVVLLQWRDVNDTLDLHLTTRAATEEPETDPPRTKGRQLEIVDTFHSYVRPTWSPTLTDFCTSLTGITQAMVDASPTFPEMLKRLEKWMDGHDLRREDGGLKDALWVTDGPYDLRDFIPKQLHITPTDPPNPPYFFAPYLNIKQATNTVLSTLHSRRPLHIDPEPTSSPTSPLETPARTETEHELSEELWPPITTAKKVERYARSSKSPNYFLTITGQLEALGLGEFEGREHSGIADANNVARIVIAISNNPSVLIEPNAIVKPPAQMRKWPWMGSKPGEIKFEEWMSNPRATVAEKEVEKGDTKENQPVVSEIGTAGKDSEEAATAAKMVELDEALRRAFGEREEDEDDHWPTDPVTGEIDWVKTEERLQRRFLAKVWAAEGVPREYL